MKAEEERVVPQVEVFCSSNQEKTSLKGLHRDWLNYLWYSMAAPGVTLNLVNYGLF